MPQSGSNAPPGRAGIDEQTRGLLGAVTWLRVALLGWAATVVAVDAAGSTEVRVPLAAAVLVALALWTAVGALSLRRHPEVLGGAAYGTVDMVLAMSTAAADHLVYPGAHPQTFASAWPMSAAVVVGIVHGPRAGALSGAAIGAAGAAGTAAFAAEGLDGRWTAASGTVVLLAVAGALAGMLTRRMREIELARARARAREEVARRLHDGVLQTLAVVQRRSDDPELVDLAREQELDLRGFLADGTASDPPGSRGPGAPTRGEPSGPDLVAALRSTLARLERRTSLRTELSVAERPAAVSDDVCEALCGAVAEAVVNADKHGEASRAVVFVDVDGPTVLCSVSDDGAGFDPAITGEGMGLTVSVRGRLDELGGEVELRSAPGRGCEVTMRCMADSTRGH